MADAEITIKKGVTLVPQMAGVDAARPMQKGRALHALQAAKTNPAVMSQLRALKQGPQSHLADDEVLEALATDVAQGRMMLRVSGVCTADKRRFFTWLAEPFRGMAADLDTTLQILLTLAAKEGGWDGKSLDHNQPLNNPFGLNKIKNKVAVGNKGFDTLDDAIEEWKASRGYIKGTKGAQAFVDALLAHHYNTVNTKYADQFMQLYGDMGRGMDDCGIKP